MAAIPANEPTATSLLTRADVLATLKIGETTLFWLQRTGKLKPIRIGSRVLFNASEIKRIATHGASLSKAEKEAAAKRQREAMPRRKSGSPAVAADCERTPTRW
jgi:hypothetical protein